jgi:hypothetical protein
MSGQSSRIAFRDGELSRAINGLKQPAAAVLKAAALRRCQLRHDVALGRSPVMYGFAVRRRCAGQMA